jgi:ferredoxin-NADP reductase
MSGAVSLLTTPLRVDDYLELVNPLWSRRQLWGRVEAVWPETANSATLTIRPGRGWPEHRAGQYVGTATQVAGVWRRRPFSVSSAPGRPDGCFQITVKAARNGSVSRRLVFGAAPGTIMRLDPPAGEFVLPTKIPERILFLTAGSGITPVMAMLRDLARRDEMPDVVLLHSAHSPADVIFGAELRALAARFPRLQLHERHTRAGTCAAEPGSRRERLAEILSACPDWPERPTWACGPAGLLDAAETLWRDGGIADRLRVERFQAPVAAPAAAPGAGGSVRFTRSDRRAVADGTTPLLVAGEQAGVRMPSGCRMGICHGCVARLGAGRVRDLRTGTEHGQPGDLVQTCVSAAAGDVDLDL